MIDSYAMEFWKDIFKEEGIDNVVTNKIQEAGRIPVG
jgi:hypothetical protein